MELLWETFEKSNNSKFLFALSQRELYFGEGFCWVLKESDPLLQVLMGRRQIFSHLFILFYGMLKNTSQVVPEFLLISFHEQWGVWNFDMKKKNNPKNSL